MTFPNALPPSRVKPPMEAPVLRWGILGSGWIAERFIESVRAHTRQNIAAVGSRTEKRADAFAKQCRPLQASLDTMATLDMIRQSVGIRFDEAGLVE